MSARVRMGPMSGVIFVVMLLFGASSCASSEPAALTRSEQLLAVDNVELGPGITEVLEKTAPVDAAVVFQTDDQVGVLAEGRLAGEVCYAVMRRSENQSVDVPVHALELNDMIGGVSCGPWEDLDESGRAGSNSSATSAVASYILPTKYWSEDWDINGVEGLDGFTELARSKIGIAYVRSVEAGTAEGDLTISVSCACGDTTMTAHVF